MEQDHCYNLVIVGGGPATVSLLWQMLKKQKLSDYLSGNGICIIEKSDTFGGGSFEQKVTYSRVPAVDLLQMMVFDKDNVIKNATQSKQINDDSFWDQSTPKVKEYQSTPLNNQLNEQSAKIFLKSLNQNCMALCREITQTHTYEQMVNYGGKCPPYSLNGYFMRIMGNILLRHVHVIKNKYIFNSSREVIGLRLQADGLIQIRIQNSTTEFQKVSLAYQTIRAKSVLLCIGREQAPQLQNQTTQIRMNSEAVMEDLNLIKVYGHLISNPGKKGALVIILGGTQSAFECADLLISGPVTYRHNEAQYIQTNFVQKRLTQEFADKKTNQQMGENFGSLKPLNFKWQTTDIVTPTFCKNDIVVVYDDEINVSSLNVGLRGRALGLYNQIVNGKEYRVCLVERQDFMRSAALLNEALVVIQAGQLNTRSIPIYDTDGNQIVPLRQNGCFQIDQCSRLTVAKGSLRNIYAFGSCCIPQAISDTSDGQSALCFYETAQIEYLMRGLDTIQQTTKEKSDVMAMQGWYDQNEFPNAGQESAFLSKRDFDDNDSNYQDVVEQETFALNNLKQILSQNKNNLRFDKVEKMFNKNKK